MPTEYIKLAWKNIQHRKLRSWLTVIGIIIGVAAIVALISVSNGMQNSIESQLSSFGSDKITVSSKGSMGPASGSGAIFDDSDVRIIKNVPGVENVLPIIVGAAQIEFHQEAIYGAVLAYDASSQVNSIWDEAGFKIDQGRFPEQGEGKVIGIGYGLANNLFKDTVHVKNTLLINNQRYKVVGIAKELGNAQDDNSVFMPIEEAKDLFNQSEYNMILVVTSSGVDVNAVADRIDRRLKNSRGVEDFQVLTFTQILDTINNILGILQFVLVGIAAISLLVGAVGIMNTMYTSVLERTKDIGIMKAIGATNNEILTLFLAEAAIIGIGGGIMGAVLGTLMAQGIGAVAGGLGLPFSLKIVVEWKLIAFSIIFALAIGMISGFLPARKGAKMNPVDSLRFE